MKKYMLICLLACVTAGLNGQNKPPLDLSAINRWEFNQLPTISGNGQYACLMRHGEYTLQTLTVTATNGSWKKELVSEHFSHQRFTEDNQFFIFKNGGDSLTVLKTGTDDIRYIPGVSDLATHTVMNVPCLIYQLKSSPRNIHIYDIAQNKLIAETQAGQYKVSPDGKYLLTVASVGSDAAPGKALYLFDIMNNRRSLIWEGVDIRQVEFSPSGAKLAFVGLKISPEDEALYWCRLREITNGSQNGLKEIKYAEKYSQGIIKAFSRNENDLYVTARTFREKLIPSASKAKVDIWGFNDAILKSRNEPSGSVMLNIALSDEYVITPVTRELEFDWNFKPADLRYSDSWFLSNRTISGGGDESIWNKTSLSYVVLISPKTGNRVVIDTNLRQSQVNSYHLSPGGDYILYFDPISNNHFSYSVATGKRINITRNIKAEWRDRRFEVHPNYPLRIRGLTGWIQGTNEVLLQEEFDIWRVSLDGKKDPVCITKMLGKQLGIQFRIPEISGQHNLQERFYPVKGCVMVSAFNPTTKANGFFKVSLDGSALPEKKVFDNHAYYIPKETSHSWGKIELVKANNAEAWIVGRQSFNESLNFFYTTDFISFKPLTDHHPEKQFNWLTTELLSFKHPDGSTIQGLIYKPENFDARKKYPVIFEYYEELSNNLHVFQKPELAAADINVPYFVSNGYIVVTPDIRRTKEGTGKDAYNSIMAAAAYVSKLPFVDAKRMGICGHSMGGYKTNFIVTHTNIFAAANANAGPSSTAGFALSLWGDGGAMEHTEAGQFYLGSSIGQAPDLYVKSSPIYLIKNVKTPILFMGNKEDDVNWRESVAMFQALRREGKASWLAQYDGQGHFLIGDTVAAKDWTIRQKQFFDHYLMNKPPPVWMTRGISSSLKQVEDGYEYDEKYTTPVPLIVDDKKGKYTNEKQ